MSKFDDLRRCTFQANVELNKGVTKLRSVDDKSNKLIKITDNIDKIMENIETEFLTQTKLNKKDLSFLFFAIALQVIRQYYITPFEDRLSHDKVADNTFGKIKEHSNRSHQLYNPSLEQVINNPVPYDAIMGSKEKNLNIGGGLNHRVKTLGHDVILGWIFGTMNIATSTITLNDFSSFHVQTRTIISGQKRDAITMNASLFKIFNSCSDKLVNQGMTGKKIIAASLIKQGIHIASDLPSKASLPIPVLTTLDEDMVTNLANYGFDMANVINVGKQSIYAITINSIIAMLHRLCYDELNDGNINSFKLKTQKIITYSNLIASTSNIIYVSTSMFLGNTNEIKKFDIGGLLVTLHQIIKSKDMQTQLLEEFMTQELSKLILNI